MAQDNAVSTALPDLTSMKSRARPPLQAAPGRRPRADAGYHRLGSAQCSTDVSRVWETSDLRSFARPPLSSSTMAGVMKSQLGREGRCCRAVRCAASFARCLAGAYCANYLRGYTADGGRSLPLVSMPLRPRDGSAHGEANVTKRREG